MELCMTGAASDIEQCAACELCVAAEILGTSERFIPVCFRKSAFKPRFADGGNGIGRVARFGKGVAILNFNICYAILPCICAGPRAYLGIQRIQLGFKFGAYCQHKLPEARIRAESFLAYAHANDRCHNNAAMILPCGQFGNINYQL